MNLPLFSAKCIVVTASFLATPAFAETATEAGTRILETPQTEIADHLRALATETNCQFSVDTVEETRTALVTRLAKRMGIATETVSDVRGVLIDAYERGFDQLIRENALDVNFATKTATIVGCQ